MKAVTLKIVKEIAMHHVKYVAEDSPLAEEYCFTWMRVEESNKNSKTKT